MVEALITASPEFFQGKKPEEIRAFFNLALDFIKSKQSPETIISAVVHMDEKTPHMHLSFVPLTKGGRLSAKDILGNKKNLTKWQDNFWKFMVRKYPNLERGESASETGRTHIPPRLFKEATHLHHQQEAIMALLADINPLNAKKRAAEIEALIEKYIPRVEKMRTQLKKYNSAYKELKAEVAALEKEVDASKESVIRRIETAQKLRELEELQKVVSNIPEEILKAYNDRDSKKKETESIE